MGSDIYRWKREGRRRRGGGERSRGSRERGGWGEGHAADGVIQYRWVEEGPKVAD